MVITQQPFCWKWISFTEISKYDQNECSQALNASYTFQPLMGFWPYLMSFFTIISLSKVSKAFFKSIKITPLRRPLSLLTHQLSFVSSKTVRVLCSEWKPDWPLFNKLFSFISYWYSWSQIICLKILATLGITDMRQWLFRSDLEPFLKIGGTLGSFSSEGKIPVTNNWLKMPVEEGATTLAAMLRSLFGILSGPVA